MKPLPSSCGHNWKLSDKEYYHYKVLEVRRRVVPNEHPKVATSVGNLAKAYAAAGRHQEAWRL